MNCGRSRKWRDNESAERKLIFKEFEKLRESKNCKNEYKQQELTSRRNQTSVSMTLRSLSGAMQERTGLLSAQNFYRLVIHRSKIRVIKTLPCL